MISIDDREAFNQIYFRYWKKLYAKAYNILRDHDNAVDLVQEIFVWLWDHRATQNIQNLNSYLHTAVKFKIANFIRDEKVKNAFYEAVESIKSNEFYLDDSLEVRELQAVIISFTQDLPEKCRTIFNLSRFEHLSNRKIAEKLGISEKTVEGQITIALKKLRISLGKISCWLFIF